MEIRQMQPPKIYKEGVTNRILWALSKGASYTIASGYGGIAYQTFREWMKRAESMLHLEEEQLENHPDKAYYDFYYNVKLVEAQAAMKWLEKIDDAAQIHWQAAAWKLERRYPNEYGKVVNESPVDNEENVIEQAKIAVGKLKGDDHGRSAIA